MSERYTRRYRIVDSAAKADAVETVIAAIKGGQSFTSATQIVAEQLDVAATTVRAWVNASGRRPDVTWVQHEALKRELAAATLLNRRLAERLEAQLRS